MAELTHAEVRRLWLAQFPSGHEQVYDWEEGEIGDFADAVADVLKAHCHEMVEALRLERFPATASDLSPWIKALGLSRFAAAQGAREAKRSLVHSRLREPNSSSLPSIRAIIGPLLGYQDPTDLQIIECSRAGLRELNSYDGDPVAITGGGTATMQIRPLDDGDVSRAGAQVILTGLSASDPSDIEVTLTAPDATTRTWSGAVYFPSGDVTLSDPAFAGAPVNGVWTLEIVSAAGDVSTTATALFVEGIGRYSDVAEGHGGQASHFAVYADANLTGATHDPEWSATQAALTRISPAHSKWWLIRNATSYPSASLLPAQFLPRS